MKGRIKGKKGGLGPAQAKIGTRRLEEQNGRLQFLFPFLGVNVGSADGCEYSTKDGSAIAKWPSQFKLRMAVEQPTYGLLFLAKRKTT